MRAWGLPSRSRNARSRRFCQLFAWRAFTPLLVVVSIVVVVVVSSRIVVASVGLYHLVEGVLRFFIIASVAVCLVFTISLMMMMMIRLMVHDS